MRYAWLVAVLGCSYDPTSLPAPDAPTGPDRDQDGVADDDDDCPDDPDPGQHDFDADGHGDACDLCPHINSSADPDGDNDGVGDACDPRPSTTGDRRIAFYGFADASELADWTQTRGTWEISGNRLVQNDTSTLATIALPAITGAVHVETTYEVGQLASSGNAAIGTCSGVIDADNQLYCCDLFRDFQFNRDVQTWAQWPGQALTVAESSWSGGFAADSLVELVSDLAVNQRNCRARQDDPLVSKTASAQSTGPIDGSVELYTLSAAARFRYIFVVGVGG